MLKALCLVLCKGLARLGGLSNFDLQLPDLHLPLRDCLCVACLQRRALENIERRKAIRSMYAERQAAQQLNEPAAPDLKG